MDDVIIMNNSAQPTIEMTNHDSLAHVWIDWCTEYLETIDWPFVMVRLEDLAFYRVNFMVMVQRMLVIKIKRYPQVHQNHRIKSRPNRVLDLIFGCYLVIIVFVSGFQYFLFI
jgi:hypothetical protein